MDLWLRTQSRVKVRSLIASYGEPRWELTAKAGDLRESRKPKDRISN